MIFLKLIVNDHGTEDPMNQNEKINSHLNEVYFAYECMWSIQLQKCGWIKLLQTNQKRNILTGRSISYVCSITISICTIFCVFLIIFNLLCVFEIQFVLLQLVFRIICTWCHHISIQLLIVLIQSKLIFSMLASHWLIDVL